MFSSAKVAALLRYSPAPVTRTLGAQGVLADVLPLLACPAPAAPPGARAAECESYSSYLRRVADANGTRAVVLVTMSAAEHADPAHAQNHPATGLGGGGARCRGLRW